MFLHLYLLFFKMRGGVIVKEGLEYAAKMDMNRH